jgi:4-amino-4-deoxy-L-arabinose transferase-like glycosyltransferase
MDPVAPRPPAAKGSDRALLGAVAVAIVGVLVRLVVVWALELAPRVERFEYDEVARNLVEGRGLGIVRHGTWYRGYGNGPYVLMTAAAHAVSGRPEEWLLALQALFIVPTALAAFSLGRRLFGDASGLLAAAGTAFHPGLFYFDTHKLHPLGLDAALALSGLALLARVSALPARSARWVATGLIHGLAALERTTFVALVPFALAAAVRAGRHAGLMIAYGLAAALPLVVWLGLSSSLFGAVGFISTGAEVLWTGNNPAASGTNFARGPGLVPVFEAAPESFRSEVLATDEVGQRRAFRREALRFISEQPLDAAALYLRKMWAFLWFSEHAGGWYSPGLTVAYKAYYAVLVLAACVGLVVSRRRPPDARRLGLALVAFFLSVGALQAVFYVETRHRWAVEPLLVVLAAGAVAEWFRRAAAAAAIRSPRFRRPSRR